MFALLIGSLLTGLALFANMLGLDQYEGWSRTRILVLMIGLILTLCAVILLRYPSELRARLQTLLSMLDRVPILSRIMHSRGAGHLLSFFHAYGWTVPSVMIVIIIYVWFISSGTWTTWHSPTRYYADLARGFERGKLYLPTKVEPNLLELANPYDPDTRVDIHAPIDISYYQGRYYLYWGPVPAVILALVSPWVHGRVGDLQLVFVFVTGILIIQVVLIVAAWDRFFSDLPKWILCLPIFVVGLVSPVTFLLNNFISARIYEAAITAGQFFLLGGLLFALAAIHKGYSAVHLILAGTCWGLSIGSRQILALPIALLVIWVSLRLLARNHWSLKKLTALLPLGLPLVIALTALGWYNWARFGSVLESGWYYQLAGPNLQKYQDILFSPGYTVQNIYNYLLNPFKLTLQFPFIQPEYGRTSALIPFFSLPPLYSSQYLAGILFTQPFAIFTAFAWPGKRSKRFAETVLDQSQDASAVSLTVLVLSLDILCLSSFVVLLFYFWSAMRFLVDFMPSLMLLSVIGFWQGVQRFEHQHTVRKWFVALGVCLAAFSILVSTLLALSVNDARLLFIR